MAFVLPMLRCDEMFRWALAWSTGGWTSSSQQFTISIPSTEDNGKRRE